MFRIIQSNVVLAVHRTGNGILVPHHYYWKEKCNLALNA